MSDEKVVGERHGQSDEGLAQARADLVQTIETAGLEPSEEDPERPDELVKVEGGDITFELRFNGETIRLDGEDVNRLSPGDFQPFLQRQKLAVEAGEVDDQITTALGKDGPRKALARVRSVGDVD